jgi:16S rRNA (guanine(966)-N(2))-methyltransferase RsmD
MRISGGTVKGRRTATKSLLKKKPAGERLRPTSSKVREAIFDILRDRIAGAVFVDLYAGTGTVGLEALSRGAGRAIFVEPEELRVRTMKSRVDDFGFQDRALIIRGKAKEFLERASAARERFGIIFVDPPYDSEEIERVLPVIGEGELLERDGMVIVEHFFKKKVPETAGRLKVDRSYRYGDTTLTFYGKAYI